MMTKKGQHGFTLVELLVCIAVGSIVTLAATTVLLLGMRINNQSTGTVTRQNTTRILLTALEDVVKEGTITKVEAGPDAWVVYGDAGDEDETTETAVFSYDSAKQTIYTGAPGSGAPLLENVYSSFISMDSNQLLTITVETEDGTYTTAAYCRKAIPLKKTDVTADTVIKDLTESNDQNDNTVTTDQSRLGFLKVLASQYRIKLGDQESVNNGFILDTNTHTITTDEYKYYTQWYIKGGWGQNGWGPDTPWCACFVSWGIYKSMEFTNYKEPGTDGEKSNERPSYAGVDSFIMYFKEDANDQNGWISGKYWDESAENPQPGDIIFFDWNINPPKDPQHVGVVLTVASEVVNGGTVEYVYTIEGNTSNMVAVRKYNLEDPRILGYGVLDWKETTVSGTETTQTE